MNLFGCLFPCALQHSWWSVGNEQCMTEEFVHRMGVNASTAPGVEAGPVPNGMGVADPCTPPFRDTIGVIVRERKKKVTGFATLKKKFIRRRRSSKACDHGRMLRELVADWSPLEVAALLEEYEALAALKDLCVQAELARPPAATFKQDLSALYDFKYCTDADLVYRGACFPIHRALLSARCPYFRDLLAGCPGYGARICLELRTATVDVQLFSALLRYLYTGDICPHDTNIDINLLRRLREEFGTPNALEADLRYLLEIGDYADAALVFTSDGSDCQRPDSGSSEYGFRPKLELPCHKAILSARSPFFRNLLQRRSRSGEEHTERALHIPTRIVLDESVIPKRYARVLLHAIYLDQVDLSLISRGGCGGGLGEAQALTHTGRARPSALEEAMELYQIGRFLELDILSQGCEDLILEWLSLETLPTVLQWAKQPHGSAWVHRQALHFLREEFQPVSQSPVLHLLDKTHLLEVLKSPFLQASELEILHAVLKWGENELVRRMEDREPNIVSHTAHSVARKGVKKRDLSDVELREILSDLLPLVRMDHVLPPNSDILNQAIRRGLVSTPPSHMIGGDRENLRVNAWIRGDKNNGLFVQPRLFMPYYDEVKVLVEDQLVQEVEMMRMRRARYMPDIPDTLYMVEDKPRVHGTAGVDVLASVLPVPDPAVMNAMLKREQKLRQSPSCQRALNMPLSSRHEINRQIRLRVVREFNLPDPVADMLENCYCVPDQSDNDMVNMNENLQISPNKGLARGCYGRNMTFPRPGAYSQRHELPAIIPEGEFRFSTEPESSSCSDGHLSDIMPDVAMATATLGQMQLQEQQEMELDLGDGTTHIHEMELTTFLKDGMVENWEIFENFLDYIYSNALRAIPNDHPLLITEPPWVTPSKREQLTELMFEKYNVPALYLAKNASLAAFANGRPTCLVVDSGATHTSAVPVHDGFVLTQAVVKSPAGGDYLSTQCRNYLNEKGIEIVPPCMVASKEVTKAEEAANFKRRVIQAKLTDSWHNYMIKQVMQDFQASVLQVSDNLYDEEVVKTMPAIHYEFPNGFHKDFGVERFKIPEPMFNPVAGAKSGIQPTLGVGPLVTTSVGMCDIDIRPAMYGSVVVTGGNSNLQGFTERLNRDLAAKTPPSMRLKIISAPGATERKFGAWSGGSILTSLGSFQQLWVSKQEYDDGGKAVVQSKCL